MASESQFQQDVDPLWQLYGRVLRKPRRTSSKRVMPGDIPKLEAHRYGAAGTPSQVKQYALTCGFREQLAYPVTWPHILAFPLHLKLLTDSAFPLPMLGLVHLRNKIIQHRDLHVGEYLDLRCEIANPAITTKGLEFDLCTQAVSSGRTVWEEISTTLYRQSASGEPVKSAKHPQALPRYAKTRTLTVPESIGRRYGGVSGDLNPIHLHPLSARLFGFPRAIAHGMWSKAHCLALLQQQANWRGGAMEIAVEFKKPLFLPGKATLNWEGNTLGMDFQLLDGKAKAPHLTGQVRWVE